MDFFQIDVFAPEPYTGNPLAVFPDAGSLSTGQMQLLAREMNLSETIFVTRIKDSEYDVRIFTPANELPFAGHPTVGCAWLLSDLGVVKGDALTQRSSAGPTTIRRIDGDFWFDRDGVVHDPYENPSGLAEHLGVGPEDLRLRWEGVELVPAIADAGLAQLIVPVRDLGVLETLIPPPRFRDERHAGAYCFTRAGDTIRARGFFPDVGIAEDPATGSAAAGLGSYLDRSLGPVTLDVTQGVEMGRRSVMRMRAANGTASIGGSCRRVLKGSIEALP